MENYENSLDAAAGFFPAGSDLFAVRDNRGLRLVLLKGPRRLRWKESAWLPAYRGTAKIRKFARRLLFAAPSTASVALTASAEHRLYPADGFEPWNRASAAGLRLIVRFGTADSRQKLTLLYQDDGGNLRLAGKAGFLPHARRKVADEARNLALLPPDTGPRLLWSGDVVEGENKETAHCGDRAEGSTGSIVFFTPLSGSPFPVALPRSPRGPGWRELDDFERKLRGDQSRAAIEHPALAPLVAQYPPAASWLSALGRRDWPIVMTHGDLAPWNLLRTDDGLRAFDWEDACPQGFAGFDMVHFVVQTAVLMRGLDAARIREYAEARLAECGFAAKEAEAVVRFAALRDYLQTPPNEQARLQKVRRGLFEGP